MHEFQKIKTMSFKKISLVEPRAISLRLCLTRGESGAKGDSADFVGFPTFRVSHFVNRYCIEIFETEVET